MKTYIIDNGSKYIEQLVSTVSQLNPILVTYDEIEVKEIANTDLVILSGGHSFPVLWHDDEYRKEIDIIKHHTGPIIGICLGFELISHVFGSHIHLLEGRRKGLLSIRPTIENAIVPNDVTPSVYENHNWSVQKLKEPLQSLAVSDDGVEVLKHTGRPLYAMQFHPEGEGGNGDVILKNIMKELRISVS